MSRGLRFAGGPVTALALVFFSATGTLRADTVVLSNGRRIAVDSALRENGKVICETSAGRLELPESIVARIEKNELGSAPPSGPVRSVPDMRVELPPAELSSDAAQIANAVVHDGSIDRAALERFTMAASGGGPDTKVRAATAETAVSHFELDHGSSSEALRHAERALEFAPAMTPLLLNLAYIHLRRGDYALSLDYLDRARRLAPNSALVPKLIGWADYGLNRLPAAVAEWKRAQQLSPDPQVAAVLEKAERELQTESSFRENESPHFILKYSGSAAPDLARGVLQTLEDSFVQISSALNYTPAEPIAVLLYTNQAFADITHAPSWVGALNDGKIRIPVQGLTAVTPDLSRVLRHELAHSFVAAKTHGRAPVWLQEGVAQWMEGKRSGNAAAALVTLYDRHQEPSLTALEGSWLGLAPDFAAVAYSWSLAVVEAMQAADPADLDRLLDRMSAEASPELAVRSALHITYDNLGTSTATYLRNTYLPPQR